MTSTTLRHKPVSLMLALTLTVSSLISLTGTGPLAADDNLDTRQAGLEQQRALKEDLSASPRLQWHLSVLAAGPQAREAGATSPDLGTNMTADGVRVVVEHGREAATDVEALARGLGARVEARADGRTQCVVPVESLDLLAQGEHVHLVRLPYRPVPEATSEGVEIINAGEWQSTGYTGAGLKIGVLDVGFAGYEDLLGTEMPESVTTGWYRADGEAGTEAHGTACAEIVHDVAPDADLYLANFETDVEWESAVAWLISQGVDIISCSVGWYGTGPRDGTAPVCDPIADAKAAGIVWAQAAGDRAQKHWAGPWVDTNGDDDLDFDADTADRSNLIDVQSGETVTVTLTWDDTWGSSTNDYDLNVWSYDYQDNWYSTAAQGSNSYEPVERVQFDAPNTDVYRIEVNAFGSPDPVNFELFCSHELSYLEPAGSISDIAASADAIAVGAVGWESPDSLQPYSAQGPTVDERTKPDVVAPDEVTTDTYTPFSGTSAAAPHVAGAAALVWQAYPAYTAADVQSYLQDTAYDLGGDGSDNLFGYGRILLDDAPSTLDFGDAPDPTYPTLAASGGASHLVVDGFHLGSGVDTEGNALVNEDATGDDTLDGNDDEDGVVFTTDILPGESADLTVTASRAGKLDAWVDFNADGDWSDTGEQVFASQSLAAGANTLTIAVPGTAAVTTSAFARFRFSSTGGLSYTGEADDGEVEDYRLTIGAYDWGDAPDPDYPTLMSSDGARHIITGAYLGASVDLEDNGQPDSSATGDDLDGSDDDDGVVFPSELTAGENVTLTVTASGSTTLDAWVDFNADGDWSDTDEQVFTSEPLSAGGNEVSFTIPSDAATGTTFARFRVSAAGGLSPAGEAPDGEVEDYAIDIVPPPAYDFGDAPDPTYPTLLASDGARHIIDGVHFLGNAVDDEEDGQPGENASGDDLDATGDDEDGVLFTSIIEPGEQCTLDVTASTTGYLDAWVDFNADGDWADAGEQVFTSVSLSAGVNNLSFAVPADSSIEDFTFARFRFSSYGGLSYTGEASDGEVEDYRVTALTLVEGDANMDGVTNIIDAMFVAQYTVGARTFDANQLICADTNDDGIVNIVDAMHIAQFTVDPTGSGNVLFKLLWVAEDDPYTVAPP